MKLHEYQLSQVAIVELSKVQDSLWQTSPGRDVLFTKKLEAVIERLRMFPEMGQARPEFGFGIRYVPIWRYLLLYRFVDDVVIVEHLLHSARDVDTLLKGV